MSESRLTRVRLRFEEAGAEAFAELLWDQAPVTCAAVVSLLPACGLR